MITCPNCKIADNEAKRTWSIIIEKYEVQMRKRYCNACGVKFYTYEFSFKDNDDIADISKKIKASLKLYPPIIKPYLWKQKRLFD